MDASDYARFAKQPGVTGHTRKDRYWLHITLFLITAVSTGLTTSLFFIGRSEAWAASTVLFSLAGLPISTQMVLDGGLFACLLLLFLTVHEFGHYFAARRHKVRTSLPYYIPTPLLGIGTMGAVINMREPILSTRTVFDIGVAGPVAGFLVALPILFCAVVAAPPPEYMFSVGGHEPLLAYIGEHGTFPPEPLQATGGTQLTLGSTALHWGLNQFADNLPPLYELYHYPVLFAAWLALFFTALNLMPVGQLDGGHIMYALVGPRWHLRISQAFVCFLLVSMAIGAAEDGPGFIAIALPGLGASPLVQELGTWIPLALLLQLLLRRVFRSDRRWVLLTACGILVMALLGRLVGEPISQLGYTGWLLWCFLLVFFIKVEHPPVEVRSVLSRRRRILGIAAMLIFVFCFSFRPLYFA